MDNSFRIAMGHRLKDKRKSLHITQEQMAEYLNISAKHYGEFERGNAGISLELLVSAAGILGLSLDYLLTGASPYEPILPSRLQELFSRSSAEKRAQMLAVLEIIDKI